eukprot:CAMPEP_0184678732 /NCGR_PEP_ID=MMETSP0312-20130426/1529_1 /TAXON_ID=31354 /ORGANISM="Compsopogon coeruleus, Strain SAG 36.94" /LENGTH=300 /DNA_ID=CAMNT_0027127703 /DNA_START=121 /DNA_END=1020 /DNA_ORIENTATION=-
MGFAVCGLRRGGRWRGCMEVSRDVCGVGEQAGWVRRVAVLAGRAVVAESVAWSVPEMASEPCNELERAVWEVSGEVDYAREKVPFSTLRATVLSRLAAEKEESDTRWWKALRGSNQQSSLVTVPRRLIRDGTGIEIGDNVVGIAVDVPKIGALRDFSRVAEVSASYPLGPPILYTGIIAHSYQIFQARKEGARGVILQVSVFPVPDLIYHIKVARSLQMEAFVEVHTRAEFDIAASLPQVEIILACDRDLDDPALSPRSIADTIRILPPQCPENVCIVIEGDVPTPETFNTERHDIHVVL